MTHSHASHQHPPLWYGLALSALIALAGMQLGKLPWLASHGFSALTVAIVLGMIIGNTVYPAIAGKCSHGVGFSKQTLLRAGIVLYGLRLTFQDIGHVGMAGVVIDIIVIATTFILATVLGTRLFGIDRREAMLIGAGSAICGAAAVMGAEPVVRGRAEQVTVAVATVVIFGTISIFFYPLLFAMHLPFLPTDAKLFAIYEGSTIHEVAQVAAAAASSFTDVHNKGVAVITKMVRVMLLAPFLIILSAWLSRDPTHHDDGHGHHGKKKMVIPWFAFGFIGMVIFNSLISLPKVIVAPINDFDTLLLSMAMGALGLATHLTALRQAGIKPLLLATILFAWLVVGGAAINHIINAIM